MERHLRLPSAILPASAPATERRSARRRAPSFAAEPDGVDGNALALDFGDGFEIDAAGVVGAVAQQHHRADGQRRRVRQHFFQAVADVRGGRGGVQLVRAFDAFQMIAQTIKPDLKFSSLNC